MVLVILIFELSPSSSPFFFKREVRMRIFKLPELPTSNYTSLPALAFRVARMKGNYHGLNLFLRHVSPGNSDWPRTLRNCLPLPLGARIKRCAPPCLLPCVLLICFEIRFLCSPDYSETLGQVVLKLRDRSRSTWPLPSVCWD